MALMGFNWVLLNMNLITAINPSYADVTSLMGDHNLGQLVLHYTGTNVFLSFSPTPISNQHVFKLTTDVGAK